MQSILLEIMPEHLRVLGAQASNLTRRFEREVAKLLAERRKTTARQDTDPLALCPGYHEISANILRRMAKSGEHLSCEDALARQFDNGSENIIEALLSFMDAYAHLSALIDARTPAFAPRTGVTVEPDEHYSDDGISDLYDALPMSGAKAWDKMLSGAPWADVKQAIHAHAREKKFDAEDILRGENYFEMRMEELLVRFMLRELRFVSVRALGADDAGKDWTSKPVTAESVSMPDAPA